MSEFQCFRVFLFSFNNDCKQCILFVSSWIVGSLSLCKEDGIESGKWRKKILDTRRQWSMERKLLWPEVEDVNKDEEDDEDDGQKTQ